MEQKHDYAIFILLNDLLNCAVVMIIFVRLSKLPLLLCLFFRINCFNALSCQCPFGGFKMSGNGREL